MTAKNLKICISTQHPGMGGGIGRIVDNYTDYLLRKRFNFRLAYSNNPIPNMFFDENVKNKLLHPKLTETAEITRTYLPIYHLHYQLYGKMLSKRMDNYNIFHSIGGSCLEATPFLKADKRFISWVATTFLDEWKSVYKPHDKTRLASWTLRKINNSNLESIRRLERKILQKATIINPISTRTKDQIIKEHKIDPDKIRIIPPPTDLSHIKTAISRQREQTEKINQGEEYIVYVGRIDKRKNLEVLIQAFGKLAKNYRRLKLIIVGDGPERQNIENYAARTGVGKKVIFTGFVSDEMKLKYISQAKVFALSSTQEGFGIVLVEALALGIPVVSTDCGGPRDIISHGKNGYLTKIGDYKELAERVSSIIADENLRNQFSKQGKISVKRFSIETIGKKVTDQYKELSE